MYERNTPASVRRSGDEFLRRMTAGKALENAYPTTGRRQSNAFPALSGGTEHDHHTDCTTPVNPTMPSLAMVYAPKQLWRCSYSPAQALGRGTLFYELDKPFDGGSVGCKTC